jgi:hypothetical protein
VATGSRIALPGSGGTGDVAGDVWTTTAIDKGPGGVIAYNILTASALGVGGFGGSAYVLMQCAATLNDSRLIRVAFHCASGQKNTSAGRIKIRLLFDAAGGTSWTPIHNMYNQDHAASDTFTITSFMFLNSNTFGGVNFGIDVLVVSGGGNADINTGTGGYDGTNADPGNTILSVEDCGPWF